MSLKDCSCGRWSVNFQRCISSCDHHNVLHLWKRLAQQAPSRSRKQYKLLVCYCQPPGFKADALPLHHWVWLRKGFKLAIPQSTPPPHAFTHNTNSDSCRIHKWMQTDKRAGPILFRISVCFMMQCSLLVLPKTAAFVLVNSVKIEWRGQATAKQSCHQKVNWHVHNWKGKGSRHGKLHPDKFHCCSTHLAVTALSCFAHHQLLEIHQRMPAALSAC